MKRILRIEEKERKKEKEKIRGSSSSSFFFFRRNLDVSSHFPRGYILLEGNKPST